MLVAALLALPASAAEPDRLWKQIAFDPALSVQDAASIRAVLVTALSTPTGRERAALVRGGRWRVLIFEHADSGVQLEVDPIAVTFSNVLLAKGASPWLVDAAAHEVLGHAVSSFQARRAGVLPVWLKSADNELGASLIGRIVEAEAGVDSGGMGQEDAAMASTQAFCEGMWLGRAGFPMDLSPEETLAPAEALQRHLDFMAEKLQRYQTAQDDARTWLRYAAHFIFVHNVREERLKKIWDDAQDSEADADQRRTELEQQGNILWFGLPEGLALRRKLAEPAAQRYLAAARAENLSLIERLRPLLAHKPRAAAPAPDFPKGQISWDELSAMREKDLAENPGHWR